MFQTLGNLTVDPRIGMPIVDWDTGGALQLAGRAEILNGWSGSRLPPAGPHRMIVIAWRPWPRSPAPLPVRFELRHAHHLKPPLPGDA